MVPEESGGRSPLKRGLGSWSLTILTPQFPQWKFSCANLNTSFVLEPLRDGGSPLHPQYKTISGYTPLLFCLNPDCTLLDETQCFQPCVLHIDILLSFHLYVTPLSPRSKIIPEPPSPKNFTATSYSFLFFI